MTNLQDEIVADEIYDIKDIKNFLKNEFDVINSEQHNCNSPRAKMQILSFLEQEKEAISLFLKTYKKDIDFYRKLERRTNDI